MKLTVVASQRRRYTEVRRFPLVNILYALKGQTHNKICPDHVLKKIP